MYSDHIQISDLTLLNSPMWFIHPVYSSFIVVQGLTILAPVDVPNTDGINPGTQVILIDFVVIMDPSVRALVRFL